jgi:hypothetical protein
MAASANAASWGDVAAVAWEAVRALGRRLRRPPDLSWVRWVAGAGAYVLALSVILVTLHRNPRVGFWVLYYLVGLSALLAGASPCREDRRHVLAWTWAIGGGILQTALPGHRDAGAWAGVGLWLVIAGTLWPMPLASGFAVIDIAGIWAAAGFASLVVWFAFINVVLVLLGHHLPRAGPGHTFMAGTVRAATAVLTGAAAWYALRIARRLYQHL